MNEEIQAFHEPQADEDRTICDLLRIRLFFWSGASFDEEGLQPGTGKFKDASIRYTSVDQIDRGDVQRWLEKSREIQWGYKNLRKRKGLKRIE